MLKLKEKLYAIRHSPYVKSGFTLIEILVVIGILAIIVVVGSTSFFNLLKGSTKTKTVNLVRQNGDYALEVMSRMIRNARGIVGIERGVKNPFSEITITNPDGKTTTFACRKSEEDIASNSASLISGQVRVDDCSQIFYVERDTTGLQPDKVTINFTLESGVGSARPEEQASINFETTVILRNLAED